MSIEEKEEGFILTPTQCCALLGCTVEQLGTFIKNGLPCSRLSKGVIRFVKGQVIRWAKKHNIELADKSKGAANMAISQVSSNAAHVQRVQAQTRQAENKKQESTTAHNDTVTISRQAAQMAQKITQDKK